MNAIDLLKKDHERVQGLFKQYEQAGDNAHAQKRTIADRIFGELEAHTQIEEEILYPTAKEAFAEEHAHLVAEAYEEHAVAKNLIAEMKSMTAGEEDHDAKMKVLQENVEHHVEEEHKQLFPKIERAIPGAELNELGRRLAARKEQFIELKKPLGSSLVNFVSKAFNSLAGSEPKRTRKATRSTAARRKTGARKRTAKSRSAAGARKKATTGKRRGTSTVRAARGAKKSAARMRRKASTTRKSARSRATKAVKKAGKRLKGARQRRRANR